MLLLRRDPRPQAGAVAALARIAARRLAPRVHYSDIELDMPLKSTSRRAAG